MSDEPRSADRPQGKKSVGQPSPGRRVRVWSRGVVGLVALSILGTSARVVQLKTDPDPRLTEAMLHDDGTPIQFLRRPQLQARGEIYDRRGQVIAKDIPSSCLFIDPQLIYREAQKAAAIAERRDQIRRKSDPTAPPVSISLEPFDDICVKLGERLGIPPAELMEIVAKRVPAEFRTVRRDATPEEIAKLPRYLVLDPQLTDAQVDALHGLRATGVSREERSLRIYPFGRLAAALIGMVGAEGDGLGGVEYRNNTKLDPTAGTVTRLVDNRNQTITIPAEGWTPGEPGKPVQLAIDMVIQEFVEAALDEVISGTNASAARAAVMDVETGEILAIYDVLRPNTGRSPVATDPARAVHPALGRVRSVTDPYEPGSTFKPFVWAIATALGKAKPTDIIPIPLGGPLILHDGKHSRPLRDVHYQSERPTWKRVLEKSLNAGMAMVAMRLTKQQLRGGLAEFGFGSKTGCGLPGETVGTLHSLKNWSMLYTQASVAMGHEVAVTPVQMLRAFSAFCRDGTMVDPTVYRRDPNLPVPTHEVLPEAVALQCRDAMRGVFTEGTGRKAEAVALYEMFGKSGTAQLPKPGNKGYYEDRYISSFILGAPFERPKIAVIVVVEDPDKHKLGTNAYGGGAVAGPVAARITNAVLRYMGIPEDKLDAQKKVATAQ